MNVVSQAIATAISFPLYLTDSETYLYSNKNPYLTLRIFAGKKLYDCINPFKIKDEYLQQEYNEVIGHKSDLLDINHRFFGILPYDYERLNSIFNNTVLGGSGHLAYDRFAQTHEGRRRLNVYHQYINNFKYKQINQLLRTIDDFRTGNTNSFDEVYRSSRQRLSGGFQEILTNLIELMELYILPDTPRINNTIKSIRCVGYNNINFWLKGDNDRIEQAYLNPQVHLQNINPLEKSFTSCATRQHAYFCTNSTIYKNVNYKCNNDPDVRFRDVEHALRHYEHNNCSLNNDGTTSNFRPQTVIIMDVRIAPNVPVLFSSSFSERELLLPPCCRLRSTQVDDFTITSWYGGTTLFGPEPVLQVEQLPIHFDLEWDANLFYEYLDFFIQLRDQNYIPGRPPAAPAAPAAPLPVVQPQPPWPLPAAPPHIPIIHDEPISTSVPRTRMRPILRDWRRKPITPAVTIETQNNVDTNFNTVIRFIENITLRTLIDDLSVDILKNYNKYIFDYINKYTTRVLTPNYIMLFKIFEELVILYVLFFELSSLTFSPQDFVGRDTYNKQFITYVFDKYILTSIWNWDEYYQIVNDVFSIYDKEIVSNFYGIYVLFRNIFKSKIYSIIFSNFSQDSNIEYYRKYNYFDILLDIYNINNLKFINVKQYKEFLEYYTITLSQIDVTNQYLLTSNSNYTLLLHRKQFGDNLTLIKDLNSFIRDVLDEINNYFEHIEVDSVKKYNLLDDNKINKNIFLKNILLSTEVDETQMLINTINKYIDDLQSLKNKVIQGFDNKITEYQGYGIHNDINQILNVHKIYCIDMINEVCDLYFVILVFYLSLSRIDRTDSDINGSDINKIIGNHKDDFIKKLYDNISSESRCQSLLKKDLIDYIDIYFNKSVSRRLESTHNYFINTDKWIIRYTTIIRNVECFREIINFLVETMEVQYATDL